MKFTRDEHTSSSMSLFTIASLHFSHTQSIVLIPFLPSQLLSSLMLDVPLPALAILFASPVGNGDPQAIGSSGALNP